MPGSPTWTSTAIWASLCFPSLVAGFCGAVFSRADDPELGLACMRAWNDWHVEVWAGTYPERIIPLQLPWLADIALAADEVRSNAERGFKAVSFPEFPSALGFPSIFSGQWDPFFAACEETGDRGLPAHGGLVVGTAAVARRRSSFSPPSSR